jgi:hypothetical protein
LLNTKDARVHCAVLKVRVVPIHTRRVRPGGRRSTKDRPDCAEKASAPSGPNSVPGHPAPPIDGPPCKQEY